VWEGLYTHLEEGEWGVLMEKIYSSRGRGVGRSDGKDILIYRKRSGEV
jgi:hypothetical protein